jgi:hypothetical protein
MEGLTDEQIARLNKDINNANIIRAFCQHDGFKLYVRALEEIIEDKKKMWLRGSDEEAKTERIRAQGVQKALDVLKQFMLLGDNSARIINGDIPKVFEK